jgi:hypothetical protein
MAQLGALCGSCGGGGEAEPRVFEANQLYVHTKHAMRQALTAPISGAAHAKLHLT